MNNNSKKNIIITGATRGLGLSHSKYLIRNGYNIALVDISENACSIYDEVHKLNDLLNELNQSGKARFYSCDLTNLENTYSVFNQINDEFGNLDGFVFNAGGDIIGNDQNASGGKAKNNSLLIDIDDHDSIFDRNYRTCLNSIKSAIPILKQQKYGKIITTASVSAGYGVSKETSYSIAKAAVIHLTRSTASELRGDNISVNCIVPGPTLTGRFKNTINQRTKNDNKKIKGGHSFLTKVAEPIEISYFVEFLLSNKSNYISGQVIRIDGGQFTSPI